MGKLNTAERKKLSLSDFALPGRRYPVEDKAHARDALSRVSANGTPEEKVKVERKVHSKFPSIGESAHLDGDAHHRKSGKAHR